MTSSVNAFSDQLYQRMLAELADLKTTSIAATTQAELGFAVALRYWKQLKQKWQSRKILVDELEIDFYRNIKPTFTRHLEYYLILNHSLLFRPLGESESAIYWMAEQDRLHRFASTNADFLGYYESGSNDRDIPYFLQRYNRMIPPPQERIYADEDCRSSHDCLVRSWLANHLYREYLLKRLMEPGGD